MNGLLTFQPADLAACLAERIGRHTVGWVVNRDLNRYYRLLNQELACSPLNVEEAQLLLEALQGARFDSTTYHGVWPEVEYAIAVEGLDQKWGVNGPELIGKLRELSATQALAIFDAIELYKTTPIKSDETPADRLHSIGLVQE